MTHVPTWEQLQLNVLKLAQTQRECYNDVHNLLHQAIPDLDRKLAMLQSKHNSPETEVRPEPEPAYDYIDAQAGKSLLHETFNVHHSTIDLNVELNSMEVEHDNTRLTMNSDVPLYNSISSPSLIDVDSYHEHDTESDTPVVERVPKVSNNRVAHQTSEDDLLELKRQALPMPISEYLKINRPTMVHQADRRRMYIRKLKHERRKASASSRIISGFQKIKISSQKTSERPRKPTRNYATPDYQVECKLSEYEMRKLTNKIYRRLPEVVRRKRDEMNNFLKIQNFKNKREYGRKLLENRRQGIINYPLRHSHDSRSLDSGHDDSLSSGERAADSLKSDPYY